MDTTQAITKQNFAPGTSRRTRSVHTLALRIAEELGLQLTEEDEARRQAVAQRVRELRGLRSQQWVANRIGVTARAVQAWEAGGGISPENIEALAELYKVDEDYILNGNDRRPSPDQVTEILDLLRNLDVRLTRIEELLGSTPPDEAAAQIADLEAARTRERTRGADTKPRGARPGTRGR